MQIISGKQWNKVVLPPSYHTDNVGVSVFSTSIRNGSELPWGQYSITYAASDKAGNTGNCTFHISIAGEYISIGMHAKRRSHLYLFVPLLPCSLLHCEMGF